MGKNIFEGAKFGDKFVARDGKIAIFIEIIHSDNFNTDFAKLIDEVTCKIQCFNLNGLKCCQGTELDCDIISRYQGQIDEKKLDKLAKEEYPDYIGYSIDYDSDEEHEVIRHQINEINAFKAGYRKAIGEN